MIKYFKFILPLLIVFSAGKAQTTYLMNNTGVTITCPSTSLFYDSGGSGGFYGNSETFTKTFTAPAGQCLSVTLANIDIESCCDDLNIYNGPTTASPLLANLAGTITGPVTYVTTGNTLTFRFTSDGSVTYAGWQATITCAPPCSGIPSAGTIAMASSTTGCANSGPVTFTASGSTIACGIVTQWQYASASTGPWLNISGANSPGSVTTAYLGLTYFRKSACCGALCAYSNTLAVGSGSSSISCDLSNYSAASIGYSFDSFVGTVLPTTDDVLFNTIVNFGFAFCYGGSQYWGGYVASNSAFVFDAVPCFPNIATTTYAAGGVGTGYTIPSPAPVNGTSIPRNAILAPWHDIHPGLGGTIRYTTIGTAPNRRFVASWESIPMFSCGTSSPAIYYTGQVKLFETTNNIEIHVGNKGVCPFNNGEAVLGLHSFDGSIYRPPVNATAHNAVGGAGPYNQWTMTNTAYRYSAACASTGVCSTLPINFKAFYGQQIESVNKLTWETSLEDNIKEFIIERSTDAVNFIEIGRALPNNQPSKYDFNDISYKSNIINYYKVTAIEKNNSRKSTSTLPIGGVYEDINVSEIYPNPVKDNFTLSFNSKLNTQTNIIIKNMYGSTVKTSHHDINVGNTRIMISCPELIAGVYIVEVFDTANNKIISQQKLIVVN